MASDEWVAAGGCVQLDVEVGTFDLGIASCMRCFGLFAAWSTSGFVPGRRSILFPSFHVSEMFALWKEMSSHARSKDENVLSSASYACVLNGDHAVTIGKGGGLCRP
jgi:hypothetical protein